MKKNVGISYKAFAVILAAVLVLGGTIGGTMAWLIHKPEAVTNTFSQSDISITLTETKDDFKMIPGHTIAKDPKITVSADSEDCYVFVKVEKSNNYGSYLEEPTIAEGWTLLEEGVYYRKVMTKDELRAFSVLKDDQVRVKDEVTKEMMNSLTGTTRPTLTFTAYAVQLYKTNPDPQNPDANQFDVTVAWQKAKGMENGTTTEAN